jgi:hypothetical protein
LVVAYARLGEDEKAYLTNQRLSADMRTVLEDEAPRMASLLKEALEKLEAG